MEFGAGAGDRSRYWSTQSSSEAPSSSGGAEGAEGAGGSRAGGGGDGKRRRTCVHFLKGRCKFGDGCRYAHDEEALAQRAPKRPRQPPSSESGASGARPGLLQALLAKEVRAERSMLLQCIRKFVSTLDAERQ